MFLAGFLVVMAVLGIYFYNQNVNLEHAINKISKELQSERTANADFKNHFYQVLNSKNVEAVARQSGLVSEKNPVYLESKFEILASN